MVLFEVEETLLWETPPYLRHTENDLTAVKQVKKQGDVLVTMMADT